MKLSSGTHKNFLRETGSLRREFPNPKSLDRSGRVELYDALGELIGNTPLQRISYGEGEILAKCETSNRLSETHYDRCFVDLLRGNELESDRPYMPGVHVLTEVTTGSAGVSFGAVGGRILGYETKIFIPPIDRVRADLIREVVGIVDEGKSGFLDEAVQRFQDDFRANRDLVKLRAPDHSRNASTPDAFRKIADEVIEELTALGIELDAFVCAVGNGTSIKGVAGRLLEVWPKMEVHGFEDAAGGAAYYKMQGLPVPPISGPIMMYGAGGVGKVHMPVVEELIERGILKTSALVEREDWEGAFEDWNAGKVRGETIGRTSAAAMWRAKQLIDQGKRKVLTLIYDKADRYGDVWVHDEQAVYEGEGNWRQR